MGSRRPARSALWAAAYVACVVLVLSFIFFEVLDVDGSDFGRLARPPTIKLDEPPQDLRRAPLQALLTWQPSGPLASARGEALHATRGPAGTWPDTLAAPALRRASRLMLARALLCDPAPSA